MSSDTPSLFSDIDNYRRLTYTTGIVPSQNLREMIDNGVISAPSPITENQIQPASLDLRLGNVAYRVRASFLPSRTSTVLEKVSQLQLHELDLTKPTVLEKGCIYIVPLLEEVRLPIDISGKTNPKSTTGRLDVFTRIITDYGTVFESIPCGYHGKLYAEIVPRTFSILVHEGTKLSQLRLVRGDSSLSTDTQLTQLHREQTLVYIDSEQDAYPADAVISQGLWFSLDLQGTGEDEFVGYRAKSHAPLIDLDKINHYDSLEFWEPIARPKSGNFILNPDDFYILASKERVRVPPDFAAEMVAYDTSVGEFRVHYAGFFDPGFGFGNDDIRGTRAVLEVRSHEVPFLIEDGQRTGRLIYERLLAPPEKVYGRDIGSSYQGQALALSKQFKRY